MRERGKCILDQYESEVEARTHEARAAARAERHAANVETTARCRQWYAT